MTESEPNTHEYLTIQEVAALLRVTARSIARWVKQDPTMPMLKIGGKVRFPRERLLRWLRAREQGENRSKRLSQPVLSLREPLERASEPLAEPGPCAQA
jgi:excisionase family DNA binding protein